VQQYNEVLYKAKKARAAPKSAPLTWTLRGEAAPVNSGVEGPDPDPVGRTTEVMPEGPVGYGAAPPVVVAGAGAGVTPG
jgi:hypothetical protein